MGCCRLCCYPYCLLACASSLHRALQPDAVPASAHHSLPLISHSIHGITMSLSMRKKATVSGWGMAFLAVLSGECGRLWGPLMAERSASQRATSMVLWQAELMRRHQHHAGMTGSLAYVSRKADLHYLCARSHCEAAARTHPADQTAECVEHLSQQSMERIRGSACATMTKSRFLESRYKRSHAIAV